MKPIRLLRSRIVIQFVWRKAKAKEQAIAQAA